MIELLLYSSMTCTEADALMLRIDKHFDLEAHVKLELIDTVKESVPECMFYWDAND